MPTELEPGTGRRSRSASRPRSRGLYRVTNETTGEELVSFREQDFKAGPNGALYAAARAATRLAKDEGRTVLLEGPELRRRYAPEYASKHGNRPYRVPCAVPGCPNWVHPIQRHQGAVCREHYKPSTEQLEQIAALGRGRRKQ